jgi:hypothetical protein
MTELVLGALVGVSLGAVAALVKVLGGLYELRLSRLLLENMIAVGGFEPRFVRLLADVAKRRRRLGLILALIVTGVVAAGGVIWQLASS